MALYLPVSIPGYHYKVVSRGEKNQSEKGEIAKKDRPCPIAGGCKRDEIVIHIQVQGKACNKIVEKVRGDRHAEAAGPINHVSKIDAKDHKRHQAEGIEVICSENHSCHDRRSYPPHDPVPAFPG